MGDKNWILQSIQDGYIFTVTDGSYMNKDFLIFAWRRFSLNVSMVVAVLWVHSWRNLQRPACIEENCSD